MDMPNIPSGQSTRRELQLHGPRPTRLKVHKDSHKIRKPPAAPPPAAAAQSHHHPPPPVIIYTVSPKIIHVNPNEFKSLVQRLTGLNSSSSSTLHIPQPPPSTCAFAFQEHGGGLFPAARLASIEEAEFAERRKAQILDHTTEMVTGIEFVTEIQRALPNPRTLLPIPENFFYQSSDSNLDLHSNMMNENISSLISPQMMSTTSPSTSDTFNTWFDA